MKLTFNAEGLKLAVAKATKGAGCNSLMPITSLIGIKEVGGNLVLLTTDNTNTMMVNVGKCSIEGFNATVNIDLFSKLIAKTTSKSIELETDDDSLKVYSNGTYKLPLTIDEDGLVNFPSIDLSLFDEGSGHFISASSIRSVYATNKAALAKTLENPELCSYYFSDYAISTNRDVICFNHLEVFKNKEYLINAQAIYLLSLTDSHEFRLIQNGKDLLFVSNDIVLKTSESSGKEDYPINEIKQYIDVPFEANCTISKEVISNLLDRLTLFVEPFDKNGAYFSFGESGLVVESKKLSSIETINYIESSEVKPFRCLVDIVGLKEQIGSIIDDKLTIHYGNESAIKLTSGEVTIVLSLLEDNE